MRRNKGVRAFSCLVVEKEACGIRASRCGGIARRFGHRLTSPVEGTDNYDKPRMIAGGV